MNNLDTLANRILSLNPSIRNGHNALASLFSRRVLDDNNAVILDPDGGAVPITKHFVVSLAAIAALGASTTGNAALMNLPARSVVTATTVKHSASVKCAHTATGTLTSDNTNVSDSVAASGTLTSDNTAPSDGDTVTIDSKVYTFKTALTPTEGEVLINSTADAALLNLIRAINHSGTPDTDYKCAAAHPTVTAATSVTSHAFAITAKTAGTGGNAIATTETSAHLSFGGATMSGGTNADTVTIGTKTYTFRTALTPAEGEVLIGVSADASLLNLIRAINHSGTPGTDYSCAAAHPTVTAATSVTSHAFAVTSIAKGAASNAIATTETSAHLSWGSATLTGGVSTATTAQVKTANNNYGTSFDVFQAVGNTVLDFYTTPKSENFAAVTPIYLALASTGGNLADVTQGQIDVWVTFYVRQAPQ